MPELSHLRAFLAVADTRNFTRAAERLGLSQQTVSKAVAALERQLRVTLINRSTHEVDLTPAGQALLRSGLPALEAVEAAFVEATRYGKGLEGAVRIGLTPAVGTAAHPRIAAALTDDAAHVRVVFRELRPGEAAEQLRRGELDLVVSRQGPLGDEFASSRLAESPAVAIVNPHHRLAGRDRVAVAELDGETLQMWSGPGDAYADEIVARLARAGARVKVAVAQVVGGGGAPILADDEFALRPVGWPAEGAVTFSFEPPGVDLPLWVIWSIARPHPATKRLRHNLRA